jgi:hypothetical protein
MIKMDDNLEEITLESLKSYNTEQDIGEFVSSGHIDPDVAQTKKFLGDYWDIFMKEYKVNNIMAHCFDNMRPDLHQKLKHNDIAVKYYPDSFFMIVINQIGNSINFQKYNNHMIVMREVNKIKNEDGKDGGEFEVTVYEKLRDANGQPYLRVDAEPVYFIRKNDIMKAREDAINYMREIVIYHDIKEGKFKDECVEVDYKNNQFRIKKDPKCLPIPLEFKVENKENELYNEILHNEEEYIGIIKSEGKIPEQEGIHILNLLLITQKYLNATKKQQIIGDLLRD